MIVPFKFGVLVILPVGLSAVLLLAMALSYGGCSRMLGRRPLLWLGRVSLAFTSSTSSWWRLRRD